MLQILGIGFASAKNEISNQQLMELNPNFMQSMFEKDTGIKSRYTSLNSDYLYRTKNSDLTEAFAHLDESDIDLCIRAINQAVIQAGINLDDIGLVIGETTTPFQTIPSQSQRVAGALGLKVKSYDILAGAASPALHLSTLSSWREERLPDYVLLLYSNLPTVFIDFATLSPNLARLSDSSAALIVSTKHRGAISILSAFSKTDTTMANLDSIDIAGPLRITDATQNNIETYIELMANDALKKFPRGPKKNFFAASQVAPSSLKRLGNILGFSGDEVLINKYGDSFSSAPFGAIVQESVHLSSGDRIYMALCGIGLQFGNVVLEVN